MTHLTHCPICQARLAVEGPLATTVCYRCGSDLAMLFTIHQKAHHWLCLACYHLVSGRQQQALECVNNALGLSFSHFAQYLSFFIKQVKVEKEHAA